MYTLIVSKGSLVPKIRLDLAFLPTTLYVSFCTSQRNPHILFEALSSQGAWKWEQYTDCSSAVSSLSLVYIDLCLFIFSLPENCGAEQNPVFGALYMHGLETQPNKNVKDSKSSDRIDGLRQTRYMTWYSSPFAICNCHILFCYNFKFRICFRPSQSPFVSWKYMFFL